VLDLCSVNVCTAGSIPFLFDPATDAWSSGSPMPFFAEHSPPTLLADGRVFVAGGIGPECSRIGIVRDAAIYDPAADQWSSVAPLPFQRGFHTSTLLPDGRVLVAGGFAVLQFSPIESDITASALLFDPATGSWSPTNPMHVARWMHTATLLPNGTVLVVGGEPGLGHPRDETTAETYDPRTGVWTLTAPRSPSTGTTTLLPSGRVLLAGTSVQLYDPATRTWSDVGSLGAPRAGHAAVLLLDGTVLLAGGNGVASSETFEPGAVPAERGRPTITDVTESLAPGQPLVVAGTGFRGDSEASSGLTNSSAVNHPIVQLQSFEGDTTVRLVPAPPEPLAEFWAEPSKLTFPDVPSPLFPGFYYLTVTADGITSAAVPVQVVEP
jgi:hypothetical protein